MSSQGLVSEPTRADASGAGGDGGDWLKRRWGDKVYSRRSKKAKGNNTSAVVSGEGIKDCDGAPRASVPTGESAFKAANNSKEENAALLGNRTTTNCVESAIAECPEVETSERQAHGVNKLVCIRRIVLKSKSKEESRELKGKCENDLETVRGVMRKVGIGSEAFPRNEALKRNFLSPFEVRPEMVSSTCTPSGFAQRLQGMRPLNQLSVSVMESNFVTLEATEKRTPKANQYYRNSEFVLTNDKFPSSESNINVKKNSGSALEFRVGSKAFKACSGLLEKLLKHHFSHIFNSPVDVKGLGLDDYFTTIKQPMDLGTVRERLNSNYYKVPREFAEDVRLTFYNAMTYNPEGHEVHTMAGVLLKIFDEKWVAIETEYLRALKLAYNNDAHVHTPTSTRSTPLAPSLLSPFGGMSSSRCQTMNRTPYGRTRNPKKPKARDLNKRDMTYAEKQKLGVQLQNLPVEKLDGIVQIIKRRYPSLTHPSKEIEVDIDVIDAETLWELDRFITNHRKNLSKMRRKNELASQIGTEANVVVPRHILATEPGRLEANKVATQKETAVEARKVAPPPPRIANKGKSSGSSTSSSDTESSSSSGSSSESSPDGSDARQSPAS